MAEVNDFQQEPLASPETESARPSKRPRVSLACQRCKNRKQKYVIPKIVKPGEQKLYVKALEERVAELESNLSYGGKVSVADGHWERLRPREEAVDSLSSAIRDLSLNACGYYIGGTSNLTLGRLLGSVLQSERHAPLSDADGVADSYRDSGSSTSPESYVSKTPDISSFTDPVTETLSDAYMQHVSIQYPVIHSAKLRDHMHARRKSLEDPFEVCVLRLVYAIGGRSLEFAGKSGNYPSDEFYEAAMENRDIIIQYIDRRSIIYLALATMYCLRAPRQPGPWTMIGLAIKLCISLGLHRKSGNIRFGLGPELDKRLFRTCYYLDRDVTLASGRPPSISDHDIDVPVGDSKRVFDPETDRYSFPLDVDEESVTLEDFRKAISQEPNIPANPPTSLTFFIHTLRMKRIKSDIQHNIYRVDKNVNASHDIVDGFLTQLSEWRKNAPDRNLDDSVPFRAVSDSYARLHLTDSYWIQYYTCVRLLLFPQLSEAVVNMYYLKLCAAACAGVCESYKALHDRSISFCYSPVATQSLFLAGLTLIYCMWHAPQEVSTMRARNAVTDCSIMLYVMTERWPAAQNYRNAFERVKKSVFDILADGNHEPRATVGRVDGETRSALDTLSQEFVGNEMVGLTHMINDITGEPLSIGAEDEFDMEGLYGARLASTSESNVAEDHITRFQLGGNDMTAFDDMSGLDWAALGASNGLRNDFMDWGSAARM